MPKNHCSCPDPPGGILDCEANQLAICRTKRGKIEAKCLNPPSGVSSLEMQNWVLANVMSIPRSKSSPLTTDDIAILSSQVYIDHSRALIVKFSIPKA